MPAARSATTPKGTTAILDSLLKEIGCAERLIYIEHQYLSSRKIVAALAKALKRNRALEIIMVLNQNPDITAYQRWQNARLSEAGLFSHSRVGLFSLWSATRETTERTLLNQIFVHSKVLTVDDRVAIVGSANLDGASLHSYGDDFSGWLGKTLFRDVRDFDIAAVVNNTKESNSPNATADLRTRLWSEHLGATHSAPLTGLAESLDEWKETARFNVAALADRQSLEEMRGHVLPYSRETMPRQQLLDLGIDIRSAGIDLKFDPTWFNVRFSPNWIRNMFL
jgi:phosphatidylserine/phosphatidylglycerophosphate/cardiolipin synthase-like enzyme